MADGIILIDLLFHVMSFLTDEIFEMTQHNFW